MIKSIPMIECSLEDRLIWPLSSDGDYTARSAYRMLEVDASYKNPSSSSLDGDQRVWKGIWKIRTPNRIHHFVWRVARDSLSTR